MGRRSRAAFILPVTDQTWQITSVGDLDNDRKTDLIWRNTKTGDNALWTMNGTLIKTPSLIEKFDDLNWSIA
jgi:hypothetical protein